MEHLCGFEVWACSAALQTHKRAKALRVVETLVIGGKTYSIRNQSSSRHHSHTTVVILWVNIKVANLPGKPRENPCRHVKFFTDSSLSQGSNQDQALEPTFIHPALILVLSTFQKQNIKHHFDPEERGGQERNHWCTTNH